MSLGLRTDMVVKKRVLPPAKSGTRITYCQLRDRWKAPVRSDGKCPGERLIYHHIGGYEMGFDDQSWRIEHGVPRQLFISVPAVRRTHKC